MNTIGSRNLSATSKVAFWCWGTSWSALALGCETFWSPLDLCSGSAWVDHAPSDSDDVFKRVAFWCLSSGGAIAPARFQEFESRGHAMTVSTQLHLSSSGTHVVRNDLSWHAWPGRTISCW